MKKIETAQDASGRKMVKGDTVNDLSGQFTGRICDLAQEDGTTFVRLRPAHQPYGQGVWYAADRVIWRSAGRQRTRSAPAKKK